MGQISKNDTVFDLYCGIGTISLFMAKYANKVYGIEKASLLKRFSAYLLDIILTLIVATGVMALVSVITRYDDYNSQMEELYTRYEEEYDIKFDMSLEEYEKLSEEEMKKYEEIFEKFS